MVYPRHGPLHPLLRCSHCRPLLIHAQKNEILQKNRVQIRVSPWTSQILLPDQPWLLSWWLKWRHIRPGQHHNNNIHNDLPGRVTDRSKRHLRLPGGLLSCSLPCRRNDKRRYIAKSCSIFLPANICGRRGSELHLKLFHIKTKQIKN